jgi:hypothetical protein
MRTSSYARDVQGPGESVALAKQEGAHASEISRKLRLHQASDTYTIRMYQYREIILLGLHTKGYNRTDAERRRAQLNHLVSPILVDANHLSRS